jgi:type II secretory pathway component GspD/PulD (secretin)
MALRGFGQLKKVLVAAILIATATTGVALAQQPVASNSKAAWRVRVKQNGGYFITVRAKEVLLTEIAADLSRRIKAPVVLSRVMEKQKVTVDFKDMPLESALQLLAPNPYVHYELQGGTPPICREIFLNAYNEAIPVPKIENRNISFVITGDTESADSKDDPLRVSYVNQRLSVNVKKQSLTAVLDRIASALGVNFSMKQDTNETVDLDFKETPLEDAISYFPPSVHLHVRKDIQRINVVPLLLEFAN